MLYFYTRVNLVRSPLLPDVAKILLHKQITSPGEVHETSARAWCTGKTQRNQVEKEVGGGDRDGEYM